MSRILDINPDDEADVVNRVVMQVHRAVDDCFPEPGRNPENMKKTVFHQVEDTVVDRPKKSAISDAPDTFADVDQNKSNAGNAARAQSPGAPALGNAAPPLATDYAQLEYSRMDHLGGNPTRMSAAKKLLIALSLVILLSMITGYMVYQLVEP